MGQTPSSFICIKHFEEKYCRKGKNDKRYRLTKTLKPVLTIFNPNIQTSQCSSFSHISPVTVPSRSPRKRIYQDDQYQSFMNYDLLTNLVTSKKNNIQEKNDYVTFYKIEFSDNGHLKLQNALRLKKNYM